MATISVNLDMRQSRRDGTYPIKFQISHKNTTSNLRIGLYVPLKSWDDRRRRVVSFPKKDLYNDFITIKLGELERAIIEWRMQGLALGETARELKGKLLPLFLGDDAPRMMRKPTLAKYYDKFVASRSKDKTQGTYRFTLTRLRLFDADFDKRFFEDIDKLWLSNFERWMLDKGMAINTASIHLRNLRAVFNSAIDDEVTAHYPFRRFKIRTQETAKRSLSVEQLREFRDAPKVDSQERAVDIFMLIFYLRGINTIDLYNARELVNGRLEYYRSKTSKLFSVKVEPEALAIIEKYKGKDGYLLDLREVYGTFDSFRSKFNKVLKSVGDTKVVVTGKHGRGRSFEHSPLLPEISSYWARHTWATLAARLDVPKETIAHALGHGSRDVTDIYIRFDERKVDKANRLVIDYVLGLIEPEDD